MVIGIVIVIAIFIAYKCLSEQVDQRFDQMNKRLDEQLGPYESSKAGFSPEMKEAPEAKQEDEA